jgi:hypothetical protein
VSPDGKSLVFVRQTRRIITPIVQPAGVQRSPKPGGGAPAAFAGLLTAARSRIDSVTPSNICPAPDGTPSRQLHPFHRADDSDFAWSRDGARLAVTRATVINDIVLFKGLKR